MKVLLLLFSLPALANSPCSNEINQYCGNTSPGSGAVITCMQQKSAQGLLSPQCKEYLEAILRENRQMIDREPNQVKKSKKCANNVCKKFAPGSIGKIQCQEKHLKISEECFK